METNLNIESANHCYCSTTELDRNMLVCISCKKSFHPMCMKSGQPSPLAGDVYFIFTCENCSRTGTEIVKRKKLQWTMVVILALYNLQLQGGGKCGYFRWREHICCFIDKHWNVFFKEDRKKSATWHGTVAGTLSSGANRFFLSGVEVLGETGWWSLKSNQLPALEEMEVIIQSARPRKRQYPADTIAIVDGPRKKQSNIVEAAVALKEKKSSISEADKPKKKRSETKSKKKNPIHLPFKHKLKLVVSHSESTNPISRSEDNSIPKLVIKKEISEPSFSAENLNFWLNQPRRDLDDLNVDTDVPAEIFDTPTSKDPPENATSYFDSLLSEMSCDKPCIKQEYESGEEDNSNSSKTTVMMKKHHHPDTSRKRKAVTRDESPVKEVVHTEPNFKMMTPYEEEQLLQKLQNYPSALSERHEVRRLLRKLMVRKLKREHNVPLFDLDAQVRTLRGMDPLEYTQDSQPTQAAASVRLNSILDRYQIGLHASYGRLQRHASFVTRLMGTGDEEESSIVSPYTERILKPFIFRDYETKPVKVRLMEELLARTNRGNPDWKPPPQSSIDYCYIRPQHIPGVNALCQEFFWPGIDMSESLQYPDFTCVALYKKVIIGFAFMVPDVKYNEAYISFIFCHPEWRRCGIATFMLYHLIQTCMGKDVTLHVSASSPAMFLYQKFGFKVEELIHDFYDKYLPTESKECRHALFLRLSR